MRRRGAILLGLLGLAWPGPLLAARLTLGVDGERREVEMAPGEDSRFTSPADPRATLGAALEEEGADELAVTLNGLLRPGGDGTVVWTSRRYLLRRGESAAFVVERGPGGGSVEFSIGWPAFEGREAAEAAGLMATLDLVLARRRGALERAIERRRLVLRAGRRSEVLLESPGEGVSERVTLRFDPRGRAPDGAALIGLEVRARGALGEAAERVELKLGADDRLRLTAFEGRGEEILVRLRAAAPARR